jgi:hypothetical protein
VKLMKQFYTINRGLVNLATCLGYLCPLVVANFFNKNSSDHNTFELSWFLLVPLVVVLLDYSFKGQFPIATLSNLHFYS